MRYACFALWTCLLSSLAATGCQDASARMKADYEGQIQQLEKQQQEEIEKLRKQHEAALKEVNVKLQIKDSAITQEQKTRNQAATDLAKVNADIQNLQANFDLQKRRLNEAELESGRLSRANTDLDQKQRELTAANQKLTAEQANMEKEKQALAEQIKTAQAQLKEIDAAKKKADDEVKQLEKLTAQFKEMVKANPNPSITVKADELVHPTPFLVFYREGKLDLAKQVCESLGIQVAPQKSSDTLRNRLQCVWSQADPPTDTKLGVLAGLRKVISAVEKAETDSDAQPGSGGGQAEESSETAPGPPALIAPVPQEEPAKPEPQEEPAKPEPQPPTVVAPAPQQPSGSPSVMAPATGSPGDRQVSTWGLEMINYEAAHKVPLIYKEQPREAKEIVVAVIDTGLDADHPALVNHLWDNPRVDEKVDQQYQFGEHGYSLFPEDTETDILPRLREYRKELISGGIPDGILTVMHGTHVTGIIASMINKLQEPADLVDVRPGESNGYLPIRILFVKVKDEQPDHLIYALKILDKLMTERQLNLKVVCISMIFRPDHIVSELGKFQDGPDVFNNLLKNDVLIVCGAGNDAVDTPEIANIDKHRVYPACLMTDEDEDKRDVAQIASEFDIPNILPEHDSILCVAAVGPDGLLAKYSNFGKVNVDLAAPGGQIDGMREFTDQDQMNLTSELFRQVDTQIVSAIPFSPAAWDMTGVDTNVKNQGPWQDLIDYNQIRAESQAQGVRYATLEGTSQATPFVAAAAALVWAHPVWGKKNNDPNSAEYKTALEIKQLLMDKVRKEATLDGKVRSGGILNLAFLDPTPPKPVPPSQPNPPEETEPENQLVGPDSQPEQRVAGLTGQPHLEELGDTFWKGYHSLWAGDYAAALRLFRQEAMDHPFNPVPYHFMAMSYAFQGQDRQATRHLRNALELEKDGPIQGWGELMERFQGPPRCRLEDLRTAVLTGDPLPTEAGELWTSWRGIRMPHALPTPIPERETPTAPNSNPTVPVVAGTR